MLAHWNEVDAISIDVPEKEKFRGLLGEKIKITIVLDVGKLSADDIGVEIIIVGTALEGQYFTREFSVTGTRRQEVTYECNVRLEKTGKFDFAFRIFPKNEDLPHRQDFDLVKWI